jgi:hypothetical protein
MLVVHAAVNNAALHAHPMVGLRPAPHQLLVHLVHQWLVLPHGPA